MPILIICDVEGCDTSHEVVEGDIYGGTPPGWMVVHQEPDVVEGPARLHPRAGAIMPNPMVQPRVYRVCPTHPRFTFKPAPERANLRRIPRIDPVYGTPYTEVDIAADLPRHPNGDVDYGAIVDQALGKDTLAALKKIRGQLDGIVEGHQAYINEHGKPPQLRCEPGEVMPLPCCCTACKAWWDAHPEHDYNKGVPT